MHNSELGKLQYSNTLKFRISNFINLLTSKIRNAETTRFKIQISRTSKLQNFETLKVQNFEAFENKYNWNHAWNSDKSITSVSFRKGNFISRKVGSQRSPPTRIEKTNSLRRKLLQLQTSTTSLRERPYLKAFKSNPLLPRALWSPEAAGDAMLAS